MKLTNLSVPMAAFFLAASLACCTGDSTASAEQDLSPVGLTATEQDNGRVFKVTKGNRIVVKLKSHGDGGFKWAVLDGAGLAYGARHEAGEQGVAGSFGSEVFTFRTADANPGHYLLRLLDKRPFGSDPGTPYQFTIDLSP